MESVYVVISSKLWKEAYLTFTWNFFDPYEGEYSVFLYITEYITRDVGHMDPTIVIWVHFITIFMYCGY